MKLLATAVLIAICLPGCAGSSRADTAEPAAAVDVRSAAEALATAHDSAWNAHDPDQLVALFEAEATLVTPSGTRLQGADALRESFAAPGPTKQTTSTTVVDGVQSLGNDLVLIDATQTLSGPGVEVLGTDTARVVIVARASAGSWKIVSARPFVPATP